MPPYFQNCSWAYMKNIFPALTALQNFQTAPLVRVRSNWLAMCAGFIGWVILLICSIGLYYLLNRYLRFYDDFNERGMWMYLLVAVHALLFGSGLYFIYDKYFPRQWMTEAVVNLEEKCLTVSCRGKERVLPFSRISRGIYQGVSPVFTTHYMYWVESEGERIPLVSFTNERVSFTFYDVLERRAGLMMEQEPGN